MSDPIEQLHRAAETFRFDIPKSHRGLPGLPVTAAKQAFVRGLKPLHIETLRPQREFNFALVKFLQQISSSAVWRNADAPAWIRTSLQVVADPREWAVRSHRGSVVGSAVALSKNAWLGAISPVLKGAFDRQHEFNRLAIECLVELAQSRLRPGEGALKALEQYVEPLENGVPGRPMWNEVFRAQVAFNRELLGAFRWFASYQPGENPFFPTVSVIGLNPDARADDFLLSIATQGYPAAFEVFMVGDVDLPGAHEKYDWLQGPTATLADAVKRARGDVLIVSDARRLLAAGFIEAHARPYLANDRTQAVTSPIAAPASPSPWEQLDAPAPPGVETLFDPLTPGSFVNFGTGSFSVLRSAAAPLMVGGEPIDMGYRLFQAGARVMHASAATAVTFEPTGAPVDALIERQPELKWITSAARRAVRPTTKRLRILTYRWHCAHQYELFKLPHDFTLMMGEPRMSREWDFTVRPLRPNARLVPRDQLNLDDFDLAILPFDESCVNPLLANGVLQPDWGALFRELRQTLRIPIIALCHGSVPFHGQFDTKHERPDLVVKVNDPERTKIVDFVGNIPVVCNSHQANGEWRFNDSRVIWHGFDPAEYPRTTARKGAVTICPGISRRPHYCGYYLFEKATQGIACDVLGEDVRGSVKVPEAPRTTIAGNEYAQHRFRNYVDFIREYSVFFNPTLLSPMPRCRAEAMLSGLAMVTTPNHDGSMFIRDGENGFVSGDPAELRERITWLVRNPEAARRLGDEGRKTAEREFHIDRYLGEWHKLIAKAVG